MEEHVLYVSFRGVPHTSLLPITNQRSHRLIDPFSFDLALSPPQERRLWCKEVKWSSANRSNPTPKSRLPKSNSPEKCVCFIFFGDFFLTNVLTNKNAKTRLKVLHRKVFIRVYTHIHMCVKSNYNREDVRKYLFFTRISSINNQISKIKSLERNHTSSRLMKFRKKVVGFE